MFRWTGWVAALLAGLVVVAPVSHAEPAAPTLPVFTPHPSDWQPDYTLFPYNLWQIRVTPEQITAQRESCQWINAQYGELMGQVYGFQRFLGDQRDEWSRPGVTEAGDTVAANLDQSAAFLDPRAHTLFIVNYPDQSEYSPLFHGDSIYRLWYQFTQISDKIKQRMPSGQINANIATANVYGTVIRDSGVCAGA
ncbi:MULTISPECIES: hypothetical protein [Mycolicibacterium]|uniref:Secreted protein n=1 Tax=Mycolicibacterium vanbaalenii (strain DSM 7251 / JCM 13017 / BCRC 16820 / KCTC 9966 / NRRL B-24157 / PYR-1) TaxID=350058 RepID=A1T3Q5_MYCVP|nr:MULTISPECIES: hypothetical protein [Mycolicibacterium]ABM11805.1 conserved hypothetical protein [Mycolicibacterium vanbaalenii PYR-1]MCV7127918.1 hypothetical protein [Mycolicibacterium vanbaalenii PYR-1]MDW5611595.1 hypothetical protein [Mycolicibacterium sp. D5.8-2]QZT57777.1 hypothetical protein JN084_03930 [Mycolicibacterium austroafricanum]